MYLSIQRDTPVSTLYTLRGIKRGTQPLFVKRSSITLEDKMYMCLYRNNTYKLSDHVFNMQQYIETI